MLIRPLIRPRPWPIAQGASSVSSRSSEPLSTGVECRHRPVGGSVKQNIPTMHACANDWIGSRNYRWMPMRGLSNLSTNTVDAPSIRGERFRFLAHEPGFLSSETKGVTRTEGKVSRYRPQYNQHGFSQFVVQSSEVSALDADSHRHHAVLSSEDKYFDCGSSQPRSHSSNDPERPLDPVDSSRATTATTIIGVQESSLIHLKQRRRWEALLERYNEVSNHSLTSKGFTAALEACSHLYKGTEVLSIIDTFRSRGIGSPTPENYRMAMKACSKEADMPTRQEAMVHLIHLQRLDGVIVDSYALVQGLHACALNKDVAAANRLLVEYRSTADSVCYNAALHACAEAGDSDVAHSLLSAMQSENLTPDVTSYNCAIRACFNSGDSARAVALFEELRKSPTLQPDEYTINTLICGFFSAGSPSGDADGTAHALRALDLALVSNDGSSAGVVSSSGGAYNVALQAALKAKDWDAGQKVLEKLEERGGSLDFKSFRILLRSAIDLGEFEKADMVLRQAGAQGFGSILLVDAVKRAAKQPVHGARLAFQLVEASHHEPLAFGLSETPSKLSSIETTGPLHAEAAEVASAQRIDMIECAMHACATIRFSKGLIRKLHRFALDENLKPTLSMWTIAINACGAKFALALKLLDKMVKPGAAATTNTEAPVVAKEEIEHVAPNAITYAAVLGVCARAKRADVAAKLVNEMLECGIPFNEVVFANAIHACARAGDWQKALQLLRTMEAESQLGRGPPPNVVVYTACMSACREAKQESAGLALLDEMRTRGLEPNRVTLHVAADMLTAKGRYAEAAALHGDLASR